MLLASAFRVSAFARCATFLASALLAVAASADTVTYTTNPTTGRLDQAVYRDAAGNVTATVTYSYDANGNRTGATLSPDTTPPSNPAALTTSGVTASSITLNWSASTDNRPGVAYRLERCQGSGCGSFAQIAAPTGTTHTDGGLTNGTSYSYRVRAIDAAGLLSGYSNTATAVTTDTVAPSAPGVPQFANITSNTATASWTAATDNVGVTGYQYSLNGGSTWTSGSSPQSLTGLTGSTNYTMLVRARDAAGNFGTPSSGSFSTGDTSPPSAPGTPTFSGITASSVVVSWSAATDNIGVTGYQYSINGGSTWIDASSGVSITGLTNGTTYTVQVRARDAAGNWGNPSSASFSTTDTTAPSAPGTPTFTNVAQTTATVSWTAATDNVGVTGYQYSLNGGSSWTNASSPLNLTGLSGGTTYTVLVRASDAAGNWGNSSSASFTTVVAPDTQAPNAPGVPTFSSITGTSAVASWAAATDNVGVTGYQISLNGGASWSDGSSGMTLSGLSIATTYTLHVRARDAAGNWSGPSSASFTTVDTVAPSAPGTPAFSSITGTSAVASWTAATDNVGVTGYQISLTGGASWSDASSGVTLSGLTNATTYTLHVRARDAAGNWGSPSANSFTTLDTQAPSAPGNPSFSSITGSSAIASWSAASDNVGVTGYQISLTAGASWSDASSGVTLSGLTNATTYTLHVRARDAAGNWGAPSSASFTTLDTQSPGAPGTPGFSSITGSSAVVSFAAASDNVGVAGYEYMMGGGGWNTASSGMTLSGLANATTYSFQVRAYDAAGNRGNLSIGSFTTLDTQAPSAPGTPSFSSVGATSAVVSFSAASDNVGVAGYEYLLNGAGWSAASSGMTLTGLGTNVSYTVHVRAYDAAGNRGDPSVNSFTTIDNIAPSAPGTPTFSSIGSTSAVASWGAAGDNVGVTRYEYSTNSGGSWANVGNTTTATVTGLAAAATTTVLVRAIDGAGNAGSPSSGSVTTIAQITIANRTIQTTVPGFNGSSAIYQLTTAGDIMVTQPTSASAIDGGDWLAPKAGMGSFQVFGALAPGSAACSSATMNTWLTLTTNITWAVGRGGPSGTTACTFDIQIRHSANPSVILGTARITISATN